MLKMKKMLMFLLLLGGGLSGYSREHLDTASLAIYYRQGRSSFDAVYRNNGTRLDAFMERFRRLQGDTLCSLRYVHVVGGSSPEGGRAVNAPGRWSGGLKATFRWRIRLWNILRRESIGRG